MCIGFKPLKWFPPPSLLSLEIIAMTRHHTHMLGCGAHRLWGPYTFVTGLTHVLARRSHSWLQCSYFTLVAMLTRWDSLLLRHSHLWCGWKLLLVLGVTAAFPRPTYLWVASQLDMWPHEYQAGVVVMESYLSLSLWIWIFHYAWEYWLAILIAHPGQPIWEKGRVTILRG